MAKLPRLIKIAEKLGITPASLHMKIKRRRNCLDVEIAKLEGKLLIEFGYTYNDIYTVNFDISDIDVFELKEACHQLGKKALGLFLAFELGLISFYQKYDFEVPVEELESQYMIVPIHQLTDQEKQLIDECLERNKLSIYKYNN